MNKKQILIVGIVTIILIAIVAWWLVHLSLTPSASSPVPANSTSTSQTTTTSQSTTSSSPAVWGQYDINEPNTLMLVDAQGRRTGEDPIIGTMYREIPNTAYSIDESTPGHPVGELTFSDLAGGQYTLYVLGGKSGDYHLTIANNRGQQTFQGIIKKGSMIAYVQNYDSSNLTASTFAVSSTASSTANITTAPANNWTPPAL